ncbi:hypothetical protein F383_11816 [Gossypium arboreum]|nr:hypothetical protein F383_11816 [Gossypium arboreum]
MLNLMIL